MIEEEVIFVDAENQDGKILTDAQRVVFDHVFDSFVEHVCASDDYPCQTTMCELAGEVKWVIENAIFRLESLEK